jgi:hypothetical protein
VDQFDVDAELRKMDDGKETVGLAGTKARPIAKPTILSPRMALEGF